MVLQDHQLGPTSDCLRNLNERTDTAKRRGQHVSNDHPPAFFFCDSRKDAAFGDKQWSVSSTHVHNANGGVVQRNLVKQIVPLIFNGNLQVPCGVFRCRRLAGPQNSVRIGRIAVNQSHVRRGGYQSITQRPSQKRFPDSALGATTNYQCLFEFTVFHRISFSHQELLTQPSACILVYSRCRLVPCPPGALQPLRISMNLSLAYAELWKNLSLWNRSGNSAPKFLVSMFEPTMAEMSECFPTSTRELGLCQLKPQIAR